MKKIISSMLIVASLSLVGCANMQTNSTPIKQAMVIGVQSTYITINDPNLTGAAVGGITGGVIGHQFGKGNGRTAMTVLGALGGAAVGSQVNAQKTVPGYAVTIRNNEGEVITFNNQNYIPVGQVVNYRNQNNRITLY